MHFSNGPAYRKTQSITANVNVAVKKSAWDVQTIVSNLKSGRNLLTQ